MVDFNRRMARAVGGIDVEAAMPSYVSTEELPEDGTALEVTVSAPGVARNRGFDGLAMTVLWPSENEGGRASIRLVRLNQTNKRHLVDMLGRMSDGWVGAVVALSRVETTYDNEPIDGTRITVVSKPDADQTRKSEAKSAPSTPAAPSRRTRR